MKHYLTLSPKSQKKFPLALAHCEAQRFHSSVAKGQRLDYLSKKREILCQEGDSDLTSNMFYFQSTVLDLTDPCTEFSTSGLVTMQVKN